MKRKRDNGVSLWDGHDRTAEEMLTRVNARAQHVSDSLGPVDVPLPRSDGSLSFTRMSPCSCHLFIRSVLFTFKR